MYFLSGKEIYTAKTYFTGGSYWLWIFFLDLALWLLTTSGSLFFPHFCRRLSAIMGVYGSPTGLDGSKQSWTPQSRIPYTQKYLGSPNGENPCFDWSFSSPCFGRAPFRRQNRGTLWARWIRNLKRWNLSW